MYVEEGGRNETEGHVDRRRIARQPVDEQPAGRCKVEQDDRNPSDAFGADASPQQENREQRQVQHGMHDAERIAQVQIARHVADQQHAAGEQRDRQRLHDHLFANGANLFGKFFRNGGHGPPQAG